MGKGAGQYNMPNSPDLDPSIKAVAAPGAPDAGQQKPSFWKTLLMGAMSGLAGSAGAKSFGAGAAGGAAGQFAEQQRQIENARENARTQSDIRFRDTQSALATANLTRQSQEMTQASGEFQMRRDEFARQQVEFNEKHFGISYKPVPNTSEAAKQYLEQASANDPNGATVPSGVIMSPSTIYVPTTDSENGPLKEFNYLQKMAPLFGLPTPSRNDYMSADPRQRRLMLEPVQNLVSGHGRNGEPLSAQELNSAVAYLDASLKKYKAGPNADPDVASQGDNTLALLKSQKEAQDAAEEKKFLRQKELAEARGASYGQNRVVTWTDENNVMHTGFARDLPANAAPVAPAAKAEAQNAQFDEMQSASKTLRNAISKMEPLTPAAIAKISTAMREGHGITSNELKSAGMDSLSPAQKDFVIWATQLNERALSLRGVAGMGQGAQDLRQAIQATLPGAGSGDKKTMLKQLDAFDNQAALLRKGVPKTPRAAKAENNDPLGIR
jgi:hypothetical protein